jgi:hypothetical protein
MNEKPMKPGDDPRPHDTPDAITGGSPHGRHDATINATNAVLHDSTDIALVLLKARDGDVLIADKPTVALALAGRINKTPDRTRVLFLTTMEGAANICSEIILAMHRAGPEAADELMAAISRGIEDTQP